MIRTCVRCGRDFDSGHVAKYCLACRDEACEERRRRYYELHRADICARERRRYWSQPDLHRQRARMYRANLKTEDIKS